MTLHSDASDGSDDFASEQMRAVADAFDKIRQRISRQSASDVTDAVCRVAVDLLPHADWASITELRAGTLTTTAATDDRARKADQMQYELGSGPCVETASNAQVILINDVTKDERWPRFRRRVHEDLGVCSVLSFRLMLDEEDVIGGLNLYSRRVDAFDTSDLDPGHLLAAHGALAFAIVQARGEAEGLRIAVETNRDIGVAVGILMRGFMLSRDQAFDVLRVASQHQHRKLRDIALDVIDTGTLDMSTRSRP